MAATQRMSEDVEAIRTSTSPVRYLSIPELSLARQHSHGQTLGVQNHGVTRFAHRDITVGLPGLAFLYMRFCGRRYSAVILTSPK